jgi:hypothetical protein
MAELTFLQKRRLEQNEKTIRSLERFTRKGLWGVLLISFVTVLAIQGLDYAFESSDGITWSQWWGNNRVPRILLSWVIWFFIDYLFYRDNLKTIQKLKREQEELREKYGVGNTQ